MAGVLGSSSFNNANSHFVYRVGSRQSTISFHSFIQSRTSRHNYNIIISIDLDDSTRLELRRSTPVFFLRLYSFEILARVTLLFVILAYNSRSCLVISNTLGRAASRSHCTQYIVKHLSPLKFLFFVISYFHDTAYN